MKKLFPVLILVLALTQSCKKDSDDNSTSLGGDQSPMGQVGTTVSSTSMTVSGISNLTGAVTALKDGVSSYSGTGTVTNATIKTLLANFPEVTIDGDNVTVTNFKIKQTTEGIETFVSMGPGIIAKYSSNVGDTYPVGSTGRTRTVVSKSTTDDYPYLMWNIKVIKVEEPTPGLKSMGVNKVTYWANHKFGLVGVQWDFTDGSNIKLPVYCSTENK